MRLKCPNCGAHYEVDGTVIPDGGRDVQCSNCGHTWFQRQAQQEAEIAQQQADANVTGPTDTPVQPQEDATASQDTAEPEAADSDADKTGETEFTPPQRQKIEKEVVNVLREEAELETSQRSDIPPAPDPEPEPGPDPKPELATDQQSDDATSNFAERSAQLHAPTPAPDDYDSNRKALLPDIEEINSTLAATDAEHGQTDDATKELRRRSGFRRGFLLAVAVFAVLALIYVFAPNIADTVPGTATTLAGYVDWVNSLRSSVDGVMQGAVAKLTGLLAQISDGQAG